MAYFKPKSKNPTISKIVTSAAEATGSIYLPNNYQPLPVKVADEIKGYDKTEFIDDLYDFLTQYQKKTGEFKDFSFNAEFVDLIPSDDESNSLRYEIDSREYSHGARDIQDPRWMLRDILQDSKNPGYSVLVYTKQFENRITFTCWSKNYRDADRFADKMEEIIDTYGNVFKAKGLNEIRFIKRAGDIHKQRENFSWYGCPLVYMIKTIKVKLVYEKLLEDIAIEITTQTN